MADEEKEPKKKTWGEMVGEQLREAGVLVLVFGFLEAILHDSLSWQWSAKIIGIGVGAFLAGAALERIR